MYKSQHQNRHRHDPAEYHLRFCEERLSLLQRNSIVAHISHSNSRENKSNAGKREPHGKKWFNSTTDFFVCQAPNSQQPGHDTSPKNKI